MTQLGRAAFAALVLSFALASPAPAAEPVSPPDGATVGERPELRWRLGPGEASRRVVVYSASGGWAQPAWEATVAPDAVSVAVKSGLPPGRWWWRVEGRRFVIADTASEERSFVVPPPPPPPPPPSPPPPPEAPPQPAPPPPAGPAAPAGPPALATGGVRADTPEPRDTRRARPARPTLAVSRRAVPYRSTLIATGRAAPGARVAIEFAPRGSRRWRALATAPADRRGRYRSALRLARSGSLRAVGRAGGASRVVRVGVLPKLRARVEGAPAAGGWAITAAGRLLPAARGQRLVLERGAGGRWVAAASGWSSRGGRFLLRWHHPPVGSHAMRIRVRGSSVALARSARLGRVSALRPATASYYGPGLYGNPTACGQTLTPDTRGAAHPSLPCGTPVTIWYHGRSVNVRVIDRGPSAPGRTWDLTQATARDLGFVGVDTIWASG